MGCCISASAAKQVLDAERRAFEAEKKVWELQHGPAPPPPPQPAPAAPAEHLTLQTIQQGMCVRVTDSKSWLQKTCREAGLECSDDRVMLLGEVGVVQKIDPSDATAEIHWSSKRGFMPVACLVKSDEQPRQPSSLQDSGDALALLRLLLGSGLDALDVPAKDFNAAAGFSFHCDLKSITVDASKKCLSCVKPVKATVVTEEVMPSSASCDFRIKVGSAQKPIMFGVTSRTPNGYSNHLIGDRDFQGTIGALCTDKGGAVIHKGTQVGHAPALRDGVVVGVSMKDGKLQFVHDGSDFFEFATTGDVRFAVSLWEPGQTATIIGSSISKTRVGNCESGQLRAGREVRLPPHADKRLTGMRVGWRADMRMHCGEIGVVQEVSKRSAKVSVKDKSYHWDLEVFDGAQRRFCHNGCELKETPVTQGPVCDVCMSFQPIGSRTWRCKSHDYDVCEYCFGMPTQPPVLSRVIRGPTWKWESQDGSPFAEGSVQDIDSDEGWFTVKWDSGVTHRYRGPPFQDVILAHQNGLQGKTPVAADRLSMADIREGLQALVGHVVGDAALLPKTTYQVASGWHFFDRLKSIAVDDARTVAVCKMDCHATVVTEEVIDADGSFDFKVKICCAGGKATKSAPITVGIVDDDPKGFSSKVIGSDSFKRCIGAMCMTDGGAIVHEGKIVGEAPGVDDGDVLGIRIRGGAGEFFHNGVKFHGVGLRGKFRFGVSLIKVGQSVEILSAADAGVESQTTLSISLASIPHVAWGTQLKVQTSDASEMLGSGAFGETWKATLVTPSGNQTVAVKLLKPERMTPELCKDFALEVSALAALTLPGGEPHPYLLQLIAIVPEKYAIVTELCTSDLARYLKTKGSELVFPVQLRLMQCVAVGMAWLVERQYVHRDLKMQNILVTKNAKAAKIADFGLARPLSESERQVSGTLLYMAPECFDGHFSQKSDVYSFSFIMLGTFSGEEVDVTSFMTARRIVVGAVTDQLQALLVAAIRKGDRPDVPARVRTRPADLIRACWHTDPCQRPTFDSLSSDLRQLSIAE